MCSHEHHHEGHFSLPILRIVISIIILISAILLKLTGVIEFITFFIAYLIVGWDILKKAGKNILKGKVFDENFLMCIATIGALSIQEYPEAVMVMVLYQIGEYFQDKAVEKSRKSISKLMDIRPEYANIEKDGAIIQTTPDKINIGQTIIVKAGEKIPLDGEIIEGNATVDTSALTGESIPKNLKVGDAAISGCINTNGVIKIKVSKLYKDSTVSKILELVEHASERKTKTENFITKFAKYYTPIVIVLAILVATIPPLIFDAEFSIWLNRALTFLVISCPCAIVISVPLGFFAGIGGASKQGILIKGSNYLEAISKPDTLVFDKTGTLTKGIFEVVKIKPQPEISKDELLKYSAFAEKFSNHPIAISIKKAYGKEMNLENITEISEIAGNGISVKYNNKTIMAGNKDFMDKLGIQCPKEKEYGTIIYTAVDNKYIGCIVIADEIKAQTPNAIKNLQKSNIKTVILTGDNYYTAEKVAQNLGINKFYSELLPADKVQKLEEILKEKKSGKNVVFVGDGINDAPVLALSDVGISMGAMGSDAAIEASDIVIMDDNLNKIYVCIKIAKKTMLIVKQNIIFSLSIKILFLILSGFGLITMWGAVFADVGVALIAILNSLRALNSNN